MGEECITWTTFGSWNKKQFTTKPQAHKNAKKYLEKVLWEFTEQFFKQFIYILASTCSYIYVKYLYIFFTICTYIKWLYHKTLFYGIL